MGAKFAVIQSQSITSTGAQELTSGSLGGLTPKAAIIYTTFSDPIAATDPHARMSIGIADGTTQFLWTGRSRDSSGTTQTRRTGKTGSVIAHLIPNGNTIDGEARVSGFIPDGVRLDWTTGPSSPYSMVIILVAGDDIDCHAGIANLQNTQDLEIDVTAPGFRPDMVFCGGPSQLFDASVNQDYRCSYGVAVNGGNQYGQFFDFPSNTGSGTAKGWTFSNRVAADRNNYTVEVDNFDADGFSLFARSGPGLNHDIGYLAILLGAGSFVKEFTYDTPTTSGDNSKTGIGFEPDFVFFGLNHYQARDTYYDTNPDAGTNGFGAMTRPTRDFSGHVTDEVGAATTNTSSTMESRILINNDDQTAGITGDLSSMDVDGFTINYINVLGIARKWWGFCISEPPPPPRAQSSWAEFEVPGTPAKGQVSFAEFEVPCECFLTGVHGNVSFAEFEVPDEAPAEITRGSMSWTAFEVPDVSAGNRAQVSAAVFKVPNVHAGEGSGQISWGEFEVPDSDSAFITQIELTTPDPRRRGRVSWAALEFPSRPGTTERKYKFDDKDFNRELLLEELDAYGLKPDIKFALAGFEPLGTPEDTPLRIWTPSSDPDPYYDNVDVEVGEIWLFYGFILTEDDDKLIELVLHNHVATLRTQDQIEFDQDAVDREQLQAYLAKPCSILSDSERHDALCRMMRLLLRYHPFDPPTYPDEYKDG